MTINNDPRLGTCYVEVYPEYSAVDSFIARGYTERYERELSEEELEYLQNQYTGEVQAYSMEIGSREWD